MADSFQSKGGKIKHKTKKCLQLHFSYFFFFQFALTSSTGGMCGRDNRDMVIKTTTRGLQYKYETDARKGGLDHFFKLFFGDRYD